MGIKHVDDQPKTLTPVLGSGIPIGQLGTRIQHQCQSDARLPLFGGVATWIIQLHPSNQRIGGVSLCFYEASDGRDVRHSLLPLQ